MKKIIKEIGILMQETVNYRFLRWRGKIVYPYFVGELFHSGGGDESGETEYSLLVTGFYRGDDEIRLYEDAEKIKALFPEDAGRILFDRKETMLIAWDSMMTDIPDEETELTKVQITLSIKHWHGKE